MGVGLGSGVSVSVGDGVTVGVSVGVTVGDGVMVGVFDAVGVSDDVGVNVSVAAGRSSEPSLPSPSSSRKIQPPSYCWNSGSAWFEEIKSQVADSFTARKLRHLPTLNGSPITA